MQKQKENENEKEKQVTFLWLTGIARVQVLTVDGFDMIRLLRYDFIHMYSICVNVCMEVCMNGHVNMWNIWTLTSKKARRVGK